MIEINIFNPNNKKYKEENSEEYWIDIKLIYNLFSKIIQNEKCDMAILKQYIKYDFIFKYMQLFNSNIDDEKDILGTILHRIYRKVICRRKMIRTQIINYFNLENIKKMKYNGVKECLNIMSSIVSGFSVPLRVEHINVFENNIIPLYKPQLCALYFNNLVTCSMIFLTKDETLSIPLLEGILDYFHFHDFHIKKLLLDELKEIFKFCDIDNMNNIIEKLFNTIVKCFSEYNTELIDKSLSLFNNKIFISIIKKYINISFKIIVPKVDYFSKKHWDSTIKNHFNYVNQILKSVDYTNYINALNINLNNEINLFPENEEEEEKQINLAIQLSKIQNKNKDKGNNIDENINIIKRSIHESINNQVSEVEEEFDEDYGICPITQNYMKNPVLSPSGNYYEKTAILNWLKNNNTDPLTRQYLTPNMLIEDEEFKKKIIEYRKKFKK